ncbi:MAG TPA: hypothetical protein VFX49_22465 [Chloroflexota bacterium]|nr:hypothetical protein [Chloroflexota bacterium]
MVTAIRNVKAVRDALHGGQLSVTDPATGYHRQMYARCTQGHAAAVYRVEKHGEEITEITMRCPLCGEQFVAPAERIILR